MKILPANAQPFLGSSGTDLISGAPVILGVTYDGTASFRPGARWGADAIRAVSEEGIETYSPTQDRDLEEVRFADLGNLEIPTGGPELVVEAVHAAVGELLDAGTIPVVLGGEHSLSPGAIRAVFERHPELAVIQFDAHADLREKWEGSRHSHACAMRRVLDFLPLDRLLQVGIRSGIREEFIEMREHRRLVPADAGSLAAAMEDRGFTGRPLYVTFDLDLFDPALLPGTGTPEPGGIDWDRFEALRGAVPTERIVALDIVELSPRLDPSDASSVVAAKLLREWLLSLGER